MRSTKVRAATLVPLVVAVCLSLWTLQSLAATARNVPTTAEAWYQASPADLGEEDPTCALPVGCVPQPGLPVNPYPENTLHVGVTGGRDTARTFIALDLGDLPTGALISGGTLTVPVLADQGSGSVQPETATVSACPVLGAVEKAQGGAPDEQPEFSCETAAEGTYKAGDKPTITVDLAPIASALTSGSVALVPSVEAQEGGATWHVAIPAREHESDEAITASLTYQPLPEVEPLPPPPEPVDQELASSSDTFPSGGRFDPEPVAAAPAALANPIPDPVAAEAQEPIAAPPPAPPVTPLAAGGYAYPAVWLAPLALAAVAGLLARSLTGEITVPAPAALGGGEGSGTPPGLLERLLAALRPPAAPDSVPS